MRLAGIFLLLLLPAGLSAQRTRTGNRLVSGEFPRAVLEAAPGMVYAGTQRFELYGVADAEQHFFVELDGTRIKRLLWVQYEGYHPSNSNSYDYHDETVQHAGRTWFRSIRTMRVPETEMRPRSFLKAKGWTMGPDVMLERLVWIVDPAARHELMVIYMEALPGGTAPAAEVFHRRAVASFTIKEP